MTIKVITSDYFRKEAKPLLKKYPSLKNELLELQKQLLQNPNMGIPIGNNCYKIRLAIKSKGKGKSGGARVITFLAIQDIRKQERETLVNLASIYDKSEYENISDNKLKQIMSDIKQEMQKRN